MAYTITMDQVSGLFFIGSFRQLLLEIKIRRHMPADPEAIRFNSLEKLTYYNGLRNADQRSHDAFKFGEKYS